MVGAPETTKGGRGGGIGAEKIYICAGRGYALASSLLLSLSLSLSLSSLVARVRG